MDGSLYDSLRSNDDFVRSLGLLTISCARLENSIHRFLEFKGHPVANERTSLGGLIKLIRTQVCFDRTGLEHLGFILNQRNYFVHKLHLYLSDYPRDDNQVQQFVGRVNGLVEEIEFFSEQFEEIALGA